MCVLVYMLVGGDREQEEVSDYLPPPLPLLLSPVFISPLHFQIKFVLRMSEQWGVGEQGYTQGGLPALLHQRSRTPEEPSWPRTSTSQMQSGIGLGPDRTGMYVREARVKEEAYINIEECQQCPQAGTSAHVLSAECVHSQKIDSPLLCKLTHQQWCLWLWFPCFKHLREVDGQQTKKSLHAGNV